LLDEYAGKNSRLCVGAITVTPKLIDPDGRNFSKAGEAAIGLSGLHDTGREA
jgi:hypothetical protein